MSGEKANEIRDAIALKLREIDYGDRPLGPEGLMAIWRLRADAILALPELRAALAPEGESLRGAIKSLQAVRLAAAKVAPTRWNRAAGGCPAFVEWPTAIPRIMDHIELAEALQAAQMHEIVAGWIAKEPAPPLSPPAPKPDRAPPCPECDMHPNCSCKRCPHGGCEIVCERDSAEKKPERTPGPPECICGEGTDFDPDCPRCAPKPGPAGVE